MELKDPRFRSDFGIRKLSDKSKLNIHFEKIRSNIREEIDRVFEVIKKEVVLAEKYIKENKNE